MKGHIESDAQYKQRMLEEKAAKWDALHQKVESFYFDHNGEEWPDGKFDLTDIGEACATAFGYLN